MAETGGEIRLTYEPEAKFILKAMDAAGKSILKAQPWRRRLRNIARAVPVLFGVAAAAVALLIVAGAELEPASIGIGMVIGAAALFTASRDMVREVAEVNAAASGRGGPVTLVLGSEGLVEFTGCARIEVGWLAVDEMLDLKRGFGLRFGAMVIPVPDTALPEGVSRGDVRAFVEARSGRAEAGK